MKQIIVMTIFNLVAFTTFAENKYGINYECEKIIEDYSNPDCQICLFHEYPKNYVNNLKKECQGRGDGKLTVDNVFEARFISWLLVLELGKAVFLDSSDAENEKAIRTVLDIAVQAVAPNPDENAVKKRFNNLVSDRRLILRHFARVLSAHPSIGSDYLKPLYDVAKFDYNEDIRFEVASDISYLDSNKINSEALISYLQNNTSIKVFNGQNDGSFTFEEVYNLIQNYHFCSKRSRCQSDLEREFGEGLVLKSSEIITFE